MYLAETEYNKFGIVTAWQVRGEDSIGQDPPQVSAVTVLVSVPGQVGQVEGVPYQCARTINGTKIIQATKKKKRRPVQSERYTKWEYSTNSLSLHWKRMWRFCSEKIHHL